MDEVELKELYDRGDRAFNARIYPEALRYFRECAEQGYAKAQGALGAMYAQGRGVERDDATAVEWFRRAAEQGDAKAQTALGIMYAEGRGVERDDAKAVEWCRRAAEQGDAKAQCNLGNMYFRGQGVERNDAKAVEWYRRAAEQGDAYAQGTLGIMYANGRGVERNGAAAVEWCRRAAEQGNANALRILGILYLRGLGVKQNVRFGIRCLLKAAQRGDEQAMLILAHTLESRENYAEAAKFYLMAALKGSDPAWDALSAMSRRMPGNPLNSKRKDIKPREGAGVSHVDRDKVALMERNLRDAGDCPVLQFSLALQYLLMRDGERAEALLRRAAEAEHPEAQYFLGLICEDRQEWEEAREWIQRAEGQGVREATRALNRVQGFLEPRSADSAALMRQIRMDGASSLGES